MQNCVDFIKYGCYSNETKFILQGVFTAMYPFSARVNVVLIS
jgi:hypothetical protein